MTRPPYMVAAQARYEERRNERKTLVRMSVNEAMALDAWAEPDETREATIRRLIRETLLRRR